MKKAAFLIIICLFLAGCSDQGTVLTVSHSGLPLYYTEEGNNRVITHNSTDGNPIYRQYFNDSSGSGGWLTYNDGPNNFLFMTMAGTDRGVETGFSTAKSNLGRIYTVNAPLAIGTFTSQEFVLGTANTMAINITPSQQTLLEVPHAEMWNYTSHGSPWTFDITANDVYFNLTNITQTSLNGFTHTSASQANGGSYLTVVMPGYYKVSFSMSFLSNAQGGTFGIAVVEGFDVDNHRNCYARREADTDVGNVGIECFMDLEVGDSVNIQVENEDNTRDLIIHTVNLNLIRIGH